MYGCQTWTINEARIKKIRVAQNALERSMLGMKKKDHIRLTKIKQKLRKNIGAARRIRRKKWGWAGNVSRLKDERCTYYATFWELINQKRKQGHQKSQWEDDISKFIKTRNFHRIAQNRGGEWERLQETFALYGVRATA